MSKQLQIRNSTAEFLIFQAEDKAQGVQVFYQDENIWATQDAIATLFDKGRTTITEHLKHVFESGELQEEVVCRKFRLTTQHGAIEGKTQTRDVTFYNLDAIISVGYRVNSIRATQFRRSMPRRSLRSTASSRIGCLSRTLIGLPCQHCRLMKRMDRT